MSAQWPIAVSTPANLFTAVNILTTTLSVSLTASSPSVITVASTTGFPTIGGVTIDNEVIFYTGISGNTLTGLTRGADGTVAAAHHFGTVVGATVLATHVNSLTAEVIAIETDLNARFGFGSSAIEVPTGVSFLVGSTGGLQVTPTSNQLVLGATRTVTVSAPTPASASRTVTLPDLGGNYSVVGTVGAQTVGGVKTFSSRTDMADIKFPLTTGVVRAVNVKDYGATGDGTTDDSAAIQAAIDASPFVFFPAGTYAATGLLLDSSVTGYHLFGAGTSETSNRGTTLKNNGAGYLIASSGSGTLAHVVIEDMNFAQSSTGAGDIMHFANVMIDVDIHRVVFSLSNPHSHFYFASPKTSGCIKFRDIRGYMASASDVPAILMSTSSGESIFGCLFADLLINSNDNATAPIVSLENRDSGAGGYSKFERCIFEVPGGGAVECLSLGNIVFENCDAADVAGEPNAPIMSFGKSAFSSILTTDITFIGCVIGGGTATHPDIYVAPVAGQGSLALINTRASYVESQTYPIIDIGGIYGRTLIGTTDVTGIPYTGRYTGIKSISATNTVATNLRGSGTFATSNSRVITFDTAEPDNDYKIVITGNANETFYVESGSKFTTQFTARSSNASSTATFDWILIR